MTQPGPSRFENPNSAVEIERGLELRPKFDEHGLIAAVATDAKTGEVVMVAWMNDEALAATIDTGRAYFWSRSRKRLWMKGEETGNVLSVVEMRIDCDQDAVWLRVNVEGKGAGCHTGARSCFYRRISRKGEAGHGLELVAEAAPPA